ncbi:MAG: epoxide hydrolase, partial [Cellvibrionales bacterium]
MSAAVHPFTPAFSEDAIKQLHERLERTRFPDPETVEDWSQGAPLAYIEELVTYWRADYDMHRVPTAMNQWPNFTTDIDGNEIHFIQQRSEHTAATPLLLTHGWPGSVLEFRHVIDRLTNPTAHGGRAEDAFHVVVPSLPGYGF